MQSGVMACASDSPAALLARLRGLEARLTGPKGPFELACGPDGARRYRAGPHSLGEIYQRARRMGDRPLWRRSTQHATYADILEPAYGLAAALRCEGYVGRRIAILLDDGPEWLVWFVAITAAGASCVLPPAGASPDLLGRCLAAADCDIVVADPSRGLDAPGSDNLHGMRPRDPADGGQADITAEHEALIIFTSGSSGAPKGVIHSHRSLLSGHRNMMLAGVLSSHMLPVSPAAGERPRPPCTLVLAPLAYIAGYSAFVLALATGGRLVFASEADGAAAAATLVQEEGVQAIGGASADFLRRLIRLPDAKAALQSLRRLQFHGTGLQASLVEEIGTLLPDIGLMTGYGMSETAGSIAAAPVQRVLGVKGGSGRILPSVDLRVVDDVGGVLLVGSVGHLEVRGDMVMQGYTDPVLTEEVFTPDGWYRCGDIGAVDAEGWLRVIDRSDGLMVGNRGEASFVSQVEDAVRTKAGVDDAALVTQNGRLIMFAQLRPGHTVDITLIAAAAEAAIGHTRPIEVRLSEELPRTISGKIDRQRLAS